MREMNPSMEFANKTALAYSTVCKPLCQELGLPQTAFDILLFLANNPGLDTARDVCTYRALHRNGAAHHPARPSAAGNVFCTADAGHRPGPASGILRYHRADGRKSGCDSGRRSIK